MRYSEADCLEALKSAADQLGQAPTQDDYDSIGISPSSKIISDRCGSWRLALAKAGLERDPVREVSEQDCIRALQSAAEILGEEPTVMSYKGLGLSPSVTTIARRFGTWSEAKEEAGVVDYEEPSPKQGAEEFFDLYSEADPKNRPSSDN